jgi:peptide deformylase
LWLGFVPLFWQNQGMSIRKIAQLGEPVLRQQARPLRVDELATSEFRRLVDDMIETLHDSSGAGLAAPQVYESVQLVVIELDSNPRYPSVDPIPRIVLINPRVTPLVDMIAGSIVPQDSIHVYEGCLSVAGMRGRVTRPRRVRIEALDVEGKPIDLECEGFCAAVVQHEIDHLHGVIYLDRADSKTLTFTREFERYVPPPLRVVDGGAPRERSEQDEA